MPGEIHVALEWTGPKHQQIGHTPLPLLRALLPASDPLFASLYRQVPVPKVLRSKLLTILREGAAAVSATLPSLAVPPLAEAGDPQAGLSVIGI